MIVRIPYIMSSGYAELIILLLKLPYDHIYLVAESTVSLCTEHFFPFLELLAFGNIFKYGQYVIYSTLIIWG